VKVAACGWRVRAPLSLLLRLLQLTTVLRLPGLLARC
jgi:hypothetical protein